MYQYQMLSNTYLSHLAADQIYTAPAPIPNLLINFTVSVAEQTRSLLKGNRLI